MSSYVIGNWYPSMSIFQRTCPWRGVRFVEKGMQILSLLHIKCHRFCWWSILQVLNIDISTIMNFDIIFLQWLGEFILSTNCTYVSTWWPIVLIWWWWNNLKFKIRTFIFYLLCRKRYLVQFFFVWRYLDDFITVSQRATFLFLAWTLLT